MSFGKNLICEPMNRISTPAGMIFSAWLTANLAAVGAESTNWLSVFDEQFADNPSQRFKMLPVPVRGATSSEGSGRYDESRHAYFLGGYLSLVRPVRAGAHVEWSLTLQFERPGTNAPPELETDLMLVLSDGTMAGIQIQRVRENDASNVVRFVREKSGQPQAKVVKEIQLPGAPPDGDWLLRYRHGLLTLLQGTNQVGNADLEVLGIPVAGVSWIQKGGVVACERMTLKGEPPREVATADQEILKRASRLNDEAKKLLGEKRADDALVKMEEASALFVKVHGENHPDSANSFANRASILEATGKKEEAGKLWEKALVIHESTLGPTHPHTTLTRFNLGKCYFEQGNKPKAKELWTRCCDDSREVLGSEYSLVRSLDSMLPRM